MKALVLALAMLGQCPNGQCSMPPAYYPQPTVQMFYPHPPAPTAPVYTYQYVYVQPVYEVRFNGYYCFLVRVQ